MQDSRIPPPIQKFWETTKELFSMDKDFHTPPQLEQQEPTAMEKKQEQERLLRERRNYRYW
jgi:hypothetical protein